MVLEATEAYRIYNEFGIDHMEFAEIPIDHPRPHQVLVRIKAVALNYRDLKMIKGEFAKSLPAPRVLGSDAAGEVVAIGDSVRKFRLGDRVVASFFEEWIDGPFKERYFASALGGPETDGVFSRFRLFEEAALVRAPEDLSYIESATLPCAAVTAWHALVPTAHIKAGDAVLILGTGGVAVFALQLAKAHGARVIITSSSDDKLQRAKKLGADELINYRRTPDWEHEVRKLTGGIGADLVVETGGAGTLQQSLQAVRAGGQVSLIGTISGVMASIDTRSIFTRNVRLQGIDVGSASYLDEVSRAMTTLGLRPVIDRRFSFEQLPEALHYLESAQHFGKVVVTLDDTPEYPR